MRAADPDNALNRSFSSTPHAAALFPLDSVDRALDPCFAGLLASSNSDELSKSASYSSSSFAFLLFFPARLAFFTSFTSFGSFGSFGSLEEVQGQLALLAVHDGEQTLGALVQ